MRLLDLFCGAGGAAMGYHRAGFDKIVGVDINPQPDYPFEFVQADALEIMRLISTVDDWSGWDLIHASCPCQAYSALTKGTNEGRSYPDLIGLTRGLLLEAEVPFVIENVAGAPSATDLMLCGEMFRLGVIRHRYFELNGWTIEQPSHVEHRGRVRGWRHGEYYDGPYLAVHGEGGGKGTVAEWQHGLWASTGPTTASRSPRRSLPPTPSGSAASSWNRPIDIARPR